MGGRLLGFQRLDAVMNLHRRVGILAVESLNKALAYGTAVFVVGLRQHDDQLGNAAAGDDITGTQVGGHQLLQIVHGQIQTAAGKLLFPLAVEREQGNVDHIAAAEDGPGLHLIEQLEKVILAVQRTLGAGRLLQLLPHFAHGNRSGMVPAFEIMHMTGAIRSMIRDCKNHQIAAAITAGSGEGMISMDQSILNLYKEGHITRETALEYADNPEQMTRRLG